MQKSKVLSRKRNGTYVSWEGMDARLIKLETDLKAHESMSITLHTQVREQLARLDASRESLEHNTEKNTDRVISALEKMRDEISELRTLMIQQVK